MIIVLGNKFKTASGKTVKIVSYDPTYMSYVGEYENGGFGYWSSNGYSYLSRDESLLEKISN